jgi:polyisoprenoid-binding protein YceI
MKSIDFLILTCSLLLTSAFTFNKSTNWKITKDYKVKFSGTDAEGIFKKISGEIQFDETNIDSANCHLIIDVNSINTGNGMKNRHALSENWFSAEKYPTIEFISNKFIRSGNGYSVSGTLKIHGIKQQITIPFNFESSTFTSSFSVNRLDYKVGTMKGMMKKVSNEIKLDFSIPVTNK